VLVAGDLLDFSSHFVVGTWAFVTRINADFLCATPSLN